MLAYAATSRFAACCRRLPPAWLRYSAAEKGNPKKQLQNRVRALPGQTKNTATRFARDCAFSKPLLRRFGLADKAGVLGEHCSSSAAGHGLCAPLGRVAQPPFYQPIRRNPEGAARQGALLLGYFLLGKQEKVTSRRATPGLQTSARSARNWSSVTTPCGAMRFAY